MTKTSITKNNKVVSTYQTSVSKRDLDEVVTDVLKTMKPNQKITVTVQ